MPKKLDNGHASSCKEEDVGSRHYFSDARELLLCHLPNWRGLIVRIENLGGGKQKCEESHGRLRRRTDASNPSSTKKGSSLIHPCRCHFNTTPEQKHTETFSPSLACSFQEAEETLINVGEKGQLNAHNLIRTRDQVFRFIWRWAPSTKRVLFLGEVHLREAAPAASLWSTPRPWISQLLKSLGGSDQGLQWAAHHSKLMKTESFLMSGSGLSLYTTQLKKINTSRVIRFTATANVEFSGLGVRYAGGVAFRSLRRRPDAEPRRILLPSKSKGTEVWEFMMFSVSL